MNVRALRTVHAGATALDFTSALYLGLSHPAASLRPWDALTSGRPAVLGSSSAERGAAMSLARLLGVERCLLGTSSLHVFRDLFGVLAERPVALYLDAGAYPIAGWCADSLAATGVPVRRFRHHDPRPLRRLLEGDAAHGRVPLVVSDGFCPGCAAMAPLADYLDAARAHGGLLIVDDAQALGVFGHRAGRDAAAAAARHGNGGGSLQYHGLRGDDVVVVASLAKGLGVPVCALGGSRRIVDEVAASGQTRVHCSPPSAATIAALVRALRVHRRCGGSIRARLAALIARFRQALRAVGLATPRGCFPVQTLGPVAGVDARVLHRRLARSGVNTVLHRPRCLGRAAVSFLITASHRVADVRQAVHVLAAVLADGSVDRDVGAPADLAFAFDA